jgi:hypothetical protein
LTRFEIGHIRFGSAGYETLVEPSHMKIAGIRVVNLRHEVIRRNPDHCEGANPLTDRRAFQFSQIPAIPNREPSFMAMSIGLLACLEGAPFIETINGQNTSSLALRFPKCGQARDRLRLGIDRFLLPFGSLHQYGMRPHQKVKGTLAGLVVLANELEFLRRRAVLSSGMVGQPPVPHTKPIDDGTVDSASG